MIKILVVYGTPWFQRVQQDRWVLPEEAGRLIQREGDSAQDAELASREFDEKRSRLREMLGPESVISIANLAPRNLVDVDVVVALGGDGLFVDVTRKVLNLNASGINPAVLPVVWNQRLSVGALSEMHADRLLEVIEGIRDETIPFEVQQLPRVVAQLEIARHEIWATTALVLSSGEQVAYLKVRGRDFPSSGLVVATRLGIAQGSWFRGATAYLKPWRDSLLSVPRTDPRGFYVVRDPNVEAENWPIGGLAETYDLTWPYGEFGSHELEVAVRAKRGREMLLYPEGVDPRENGLVINTAETIRFFVTADRGLRLAVVAH